MQVLTVTNKIHLVDDTQKVFELNTLIKVLAYFGRERVQFTHIAAL